MSSILFKTNFYGCTNKEKFLNALNMTGSNTPDETGVMFTDLFALGHKRLCIRDKTNGHQPMSEYNHHLAFCGQIYNIKEIQDNKSEHSDTKGLLKCLINLQEAAFDKLNGSFSFVYINNDTVYAVRDHIGSKPLYYSFIDDDIIISTNIKGILEYGVEAVMGQLEICNLLGLSPSHKPGHTLYKGIYEIKPGHYLKFNKKDGIKMVKYFDVKREPHIMDYQSTVDYVRYLVKDSVEKELVSDYGISCLLSGGLDSSIVGAIASDKVSKLKTYSIDYEDNNIDFKPNEFEKSRDAEFIPFMINKYDLNHTSNLIDNCTIIDYLKSCVELRDGPGMADIDASLLYLCKEVGNNYKCTLTGECADELFGGYAWFKNPDLSTFPWIRNLDYRLSLVNKKILDKVDVKKFVDDTLKEAIKEAPVDENDNEKQKKELQMNYLNLKFVMTQLLDRMSSIGAGVNVEGRIPFADKRIVKFAYNIPYEYKCYNGIEKGILRDAFKDILPEEIVNRRKSPYPKSQAKSYHNKIKREFEKLFSKDSRIFEIFDKQKLFELLDKDEMDCPWYGQLMRYDSFLGYLLQVNYWLEKYNVRIDI